MIARIWRGTVPVDKADAYLKYLQETGIADYLATSGNAGVTVLEQEGGDVVHFLLLSYWDSVESIRAFAGDEIEKARYYPDDSAFLIDMPLKVEHYEVISAAPPVLEVNNPINRS